MDAQDILTNLRRSIDEFERRGSHFVTVPQLVRWADSLEKDISESIEHIKLEHARETEVMRLEHLNKLEEYKAQRSSELERQKGAVAAYIESFKSTVEAGRESLKAAVLINGGAAVVLVGFLGAVASRAGAKDLGIAMAEPLTAFGVGVACATVGFGTRYLAQGLFTGFDLSRARKVFAWAFQISSVILAIAAYGLFSLGLWLAQAAFTTHFQQLT